MATKLLISPAQRFQLLALVHSEDHKIPDGQAGRRYRRFMRAFGLKHVADVAREHGGVRARSAADERTKDIVEVDAEAIEYGLEVAGRSRSALQEDILGELFDTLDNLKAGRAYDEPTGALLDVGNDESKWLPEGVQEVAPNGLKERAA